MFPLDGVQCGNAWSSPLLGAATCSFAVSVVFVPVGSPASGVVFMV